MQNYHTNIFLEDLNAVSLKCTSHSSSQSLREQKGLPSLNALYSVQFSSDQSLSRVQLFMTPWTTACQASQSISNSQSLVNLMSIESVMPSNHLILCLPLLLPPLVFPSIRVFSNELVLRITWPKYWNFASHLLS